MAKKMNHYAAASCSWIDPATGLPENDRPVTQNTVSRSFLVGNDGYRFCNFVEASINFDENSNTLISADFSNATGIYRAKSYGGISSHAFLTKKSISHGKEAVIFRQIVGARTVTPEAVGLGAGATIGAVAAAYAVKVGVLGSAVPVWGTALGMLTGLALGAIVGLAAARQISGFPPIWSDIEIELGFDGTRSATLRRHSIFPSLTFYIQKIVGGNPRMSEFELSSYPENRPYYDATKDTELPEWQEHGWGSTSVKQQLGPAKGNPWGIDKGITGGGDSVPN